MSWVDAFYVKNPRLCAPTIKRSLWIDGEKMARSMVQLFKEKNLGDESLMLDITFRIVRARGSYSDVRTNGQANHSHA